MTAGRSFKVGVIGCGKISNSYLPQCNAFDILAVAACADIDMDLARKQAARYNTPKACTLKELLADPKIDISPVANKRGLTRMALT